MNEVTILVIFLSLIITELTMIIVLVKRGIKGIRKRKRGVHPEKDIEQKTTSSNLHIRTAQVSQEDELPILLNFVFQNWKKYQRGDMK